MPFLFGGNMKYYRVIIETREIYETYVIANNSRDAVKKATHKEGLLGADSVYNEVKEITKEEYNDNK